MGQTKKTILKKLGWSLLIMVPGEKFEKCKVERVKNKNERRKGNGWVIRSKDR